LPAQSTDKAVDQIGDVVGSRVQGKMTRIGNVDPGAPDPSLVSAQVACHRMLGDCRKRRQDAAGATAEQLDERIADTFVSSILISPDRTFDHIP
jgi:6-phosphogluconate dehydrogenase